MLQDDEVPVRAEDAVEAPAPVSPEAAGEPPDTKPGETEPAQTDPDRNWVNQELELLISAAIVFSLFQLPSLLDRAFQRVEIHLSAEVGTLVFMPYYLAKLVVYGLIATFLVHFLLRSLWVALLGLQSAFPDGIQWDRLKLGPVALEKYRDLPEVETLERPVDRAASSLFAFLFVFVVMMVMMVLWSVVMGGFSYLVAKLAWPDDVDGKAWVLFMILMGIFVGLSSLTALLDRALGSRHGHRFPGWVRSAVRRAYDVLQKTGPNRLYLPIFFTLSSSRVSRQRLNIILVVFVYSLIGVFMVGLMADRGILRLDSYTYYPDRTEEWGMSPRHYDALRPPGDTASLPSLSSDVVQGPYLRLFLPYDAVEDNERIATLCPDLAPLHADGLRLRHRETPPEETFRAVLACLGNLYRVTLDGDPLQDLDWLFYTHPAGDIRGWLTYLPTTDLAPGRHMLVVEHVELPRPEAEADAGAPEDTEQAEEAAEDRDKDEEEHDSARDVHHLPFWK